MEQVITENNIGNKVAVLPKKTDAVFAKVGYDITRYEDLDNLRGLSNRLFEVAGEWQNTLINIAHA